MKSFPFLLTSALAALGLGDLSHAAETRIWTSHKGSTLEGTFVKADATAVTLADKSGKPVELKLEDLSIGDRQYLVEQSQADAKILSLGQPGVPEKEFRLDEKTFVKKPDKADFGAAKLELMQTEHFVIAYAGDVRPNLFAEAAERLWFGMAAEHMDFRKNWGDKRMMIGVVQDAKSHQAFGQWYFQALKDNGKADQAGRLASSWDDGGSKGLQLPATEAQKYGVMEYDSYFYLPDTGKYKKPMTPQLVHYLASHLIRYATGPVNKKGTFAFFNGHAFYKEIELAGEVQTGLGNTSGTDTFTKEHKEGFKDKWSAELKKLVRKGDVKPDLAAMQELDFKDGTPENMALMYAYSAYLQSTNLRLTHFDHLVTQIDKAGRMPAAEEIAKLYGLDSVAAFNAEWTQYILSNDFK